MSEVEGMSFLDRHMAGVSFLSEPSRGAVGVGCSVANLASLPSCSTSYTPGPRGVTALPPSFTGKGNIKVRKSEAGEVGSHTSPPPRGGCGVIRSVQAFEGLDLETS